MRFLYENVSGKFRYGYVDDTVVVLMEDFANHINSIYPAIKFTREEETEKSLAVLDGKITRNDLEKLCFDEIRGISRLGEHTGAHNHSFAPEAVTVKCKENYWFRRGNLDCYQTEIEAGRLSPGLQPTFVVT